jgi:hypothetical protein
MINFKKALPRRTFLRGSGVAVAVPFLDAMVPSMTALAQTAANRPPRAGFVYVPHGMIMTDETNWWTPTTTGSNFELTRTLEPLARHHDKLTIVSNLMGADTSGQHTGAPTAWLTDTIPKKTQGADMAAGISIDQVIAQQIGQDSIFPSMQLAIEDIGALVGACDFGYSCAYLDTLSYSSPTNPLPMQINPRIVFEQMFGGTGTAEQRFARMQENRSILDSIMDETNTVAKNLSAQDKTRVDDFLENIRQVERRIQNSESRNDELSASAPTSPVGIPESYEEHVGVMFDLLHVAYQADITRVFTFMMARDLSHLSYPEIGVVDPHHAISHHQNSEETMEKHFRVNYYHLQQFTKFVDKLADTPDGDGSILDNTMLMYGSGMSNGNAHVKLRLPTAIVSGLVEGNRHIQPEDMTQTIGDLHIDIAKAMGVHVESHGRSRINGTVGLV